VEFIDETGLFITQKTVNKLLIQNIDSVTSIGKETLVLNRMERRLLKNPMIKNAEVFVTIDGALGVKILQRKPIARVSGSPDFYLDEDGKKMPLSSVYSARVPIITGISEDEFSDATRLLLKINEDDFMKECVVGLHFEKDRNIKLRMRKNNFKVLFGKPIEIENKFQKFKAFYKLTKQDSSLSKYSLVNLQFSNQVVAKKRIANGE
jgi:cell division protein FtsQ